MARFCPLFSGSKGNAYYIGTKSQGVLIDAGVSCRRLVQALAYYDLQPEQISGIFVTHEHSDHIAGLRVFAERYRTDVFASPGTLDALDSLGVLSSRFRMRPIAEGADCAGMSITSFSTSHDSAESVGYRVVTSDQRTLVLATDTGMLTQPTREALSCCDFAVIESNHDVRMLQNGRYPYPLKQRILSDVGHLSNDSCASFLPTVVRGGATRILLTHLSEENNMPLLARQTAISELSTHGMRENVDFKLMVAPVENRDAPEFF